MEKLLDYSGASILDTFKKHTNTEWLAEEVLDDGNRIKVSIRKSDNEITFDFTGSAPVHPGNLNATFAILNSAVVYVLRLMIDEPLPLNEGLMKYVKIQVPEGMLNPTFGADPMQSPAVVGGNTETSQRIVDTIIKALRLAACSQGTMNNLIFGNEGFGFYETIGGGVGAGNGFNGANAVHQHMTNTKITDPEILEFRYPVVLEKMGIRKNSGGDGQWKGGNGIVRQLRFEEDVILTILSQHRVEKPFGMEGGQAGETGKQTVIRKSGEEIQLKGIDTIELRKGDRIRIETPGGGGFGVL
jgi:5-oxoprolinase (ATP-hydrolysing)